MIPIYISTLFFKLNKNQPLNLNDFSVGTTIEAYDNPEDIIEEKQNSNIYIGSINVNKKYFFIDCEIDDILWYIHNKPEVLSKKIFNKNISINQILKFLKECDEEINHLFSISESFFYLSLISHIIEKIVSELNEDDIYSDEEIINKIINDIKNQLHFLKDHTKIINQFQEILKLTYKIESKNIMKKHLLYEILITLYFLMSLFPKQSVETNVSLENKLFLYLKEKIRDDNIYGYIIKRTNHGNIFKFIKKPDFQEINYISIT